MSPSEAGGVLAWKGHVQHGLDKKAFLTSSKYLQRMMTMHPQLVINLCIYIIVMILLFALNTIGTNYLYQSSSSSSSSSRSLLLQDDEGKGLFLVLLIVSGSTIVYNCIRAFTFYLSNVLLKDPLGHFAVQDLLYSVYHFHPLWLTSSFVSIHQLQSKVIDKGFNSFSMVLNRLTYVGPMFMTFLSSIWILYKLHAHIAMLFLFVVMLLETFVVLPWKDQVSKTRATITKTSRLRFAMVERLEMQKLAAMKTRGPFDYMALVQRILAYRKYFMQSTYQCDVKIAWLTILSNCSMELLSFVILFWYLIYEPSQRVAVEEGSSPEVVTTCSSSSESAEVSSAQVLTMIALFNALRAISANISGVIEHRKYLMNEMSEYAPASSVLETAMTTETLHDQLSLKDTQLSPALFEGNVTKLASFISSHSAQLSQLKLTIHPTQITTCNATRQHQVRIEQELVFQGNELIFLTGPNGSGKSLFLSGLSGKFEPHTQHVSSLPALQSSGFGNTSFLTSIELESKAAKLHFETSAWNLLTMSRCGMIAEFNQQVDGINLAAKDSLTLGDFFLRMNHLLHDCVDERYRLHYGDIQQYVFMCWLQSLEASGLTRRLLPSTPLDSANQDDWLKVCNITLNGLSGGEQQRLRLASLIFVEKIKYEVYCGKLSKDVFGALSLHPVQLLLLDEPDQFIDQNFFSVLSNLLKCLDEEHRQVLSIVVVVHKEVSELTLSSKEIDLPMRLRQLQISAPSDVDHDGSNITKTFSLIRCVS